MAEINLQHTITYSVHGRGDGRARLAATEAPISLFEFDVELQCVVHGLRCDYPHAEVSAIIARQGAFYIDLLDSTDPVLTLIGYAEKRKLENDADWKADVIERVMDREDIANGDPNDEHRTR